MLSLYDITELQRDYNKICGFIVKRFLFVLMKTCKYEEVSVEGDISGEIFKTKGKVKKDVFINDMK